jgi:hypothetical protein
MSASTTAPKLSPRALAEAKRVLDAAARRRLGERLETKTPTTNAYKRPLSRTEP